MSEIMVVGSINMDVVNHVDQFAKPGETIHGRLTEFVPGGKGANQAIAAARSGAKVRMVGAVARDSFGTELVSSLRAAEVDSDYVVIKEGTSGMAFITVNSFAENEIILSSGSNGKLTEADIPDFSQFPEVKTILLQNEIPWQVCQFVIKQANIHKIPVIVNPAPAFQITDSDLSMIDMIVLNETEAEFITNAKMDSIEKVGKRLIGRGAREVLLTLGERGCYYANNQGHTVEMRAYPVKAVDTTAAGDTFIGAFTAARIKGLQVEDCLRFASAAAALSVTKRGAQSSIPLEFETAQFIYDNVNCSLVVPLF
jgi:ribokinase